MRTISPEDHLAFLCSQRAASFLQTPAWGRVKSEWRHESLGWYAGPEGSELVGAGLVLYRQLPKVKRYLAYLPEGPVLDWSTDRLGDWLAPMAAHLKAQGSFGVRMGPPVVTRRWTAAQVKEGLADPGVRKLADLAPTERDAVGARVVSQLRLARLAPAGDRRGVRPRTAAVRLPGPAGRPHRGRRPGRHEPALAPQHQEGRQVRRRGDDQLRAR